MVVVTPNDRPKSVRSRCVIGVVAFVFGIFCWCKGFCHKTESDLFLVLFRRDYKHTTGLGANIIEHTYE